MQRPPLINGGKICLAWLSILVATLVITLVPHLVGRAFDAIKAFGEHVRTWPIRSVLAACASQTQWYTMELCFLDNVDSGHDALVTTKIGYHTRQMLDQLVGNPSCAKCWVVPQSFPWQFWLQ
jgi:hypothetical protein